MKKNITQQQILDAAFKLTIENGLDKLALKDVAEAIGIRSPSLYNHFNGLRALRHAMSSALYVEFNARMASVLAGKTGVDAIRIWAITYRQFALEKRAAYDLLWDFADITDPQLRAPMHDHNNLLKALLAPFAKNEADLLTLHRGWRSFLHGYLALSLHGFFKDDDSRDASFEALLEQHLAQLTAQKEA